MILADKIINERKKNGWSQEELSEMLGVSRQSVSKWESAQSVPDLSKILRLAEIFSVSTDYLLKDDIDSSDSSAFDSYSQNTDDVPPLRKVSMEEANEFIDVTKKISGAIANAVSFCVLSPVVLILLASLANGKVAGVTEALATGVGITVLLVMVAIAVYTFITTGIKLKDFEYLKTEDFETAYGVSGMVKEKNKAFESRYMFFLTTGITLFILCALPIIISTVVTSNEIIIASMVCVTLVMVSVGVNLVIRVGTVHSSYKALLMEDDFSSRAKATEKKVGPIMGAYWMIMVAIYLGISFVTNRWDYSWIVWPIAGILCGAVRTIIKVCEKN